MSRIVAIAFAAVVSAAGVFAPAHATMSLPVPQISVIEPARMCFDKFCDVNGRNCRYRPKQCPRGPVQ